MSAHLTTDDPTAATPLAGRPVLMTLGAGSTAQSCTGTTNAAGNASCTIGNVSGDSGGCHQTAGSAPVSVNFAGDAYYRPAGASGTVTIAGIADTRRFRDRRQVSRHAALAHGAVHHGDQRQPGELLGLPAVEDQPVQRREQRAGVHEGLHRQRPIEPRPARPAQRLRLWHDLDVGPGQQLAPTLDRPGRTSSWWSPATSTNRARPNPATSNMSSSSRWLRGTAQHRDTTGTGRSSPGSAERPSADSSAPPGRPLSRPGGLRVHGVGGSLRTFWSVRAAPP